MRADIHGGPEQKLQSEAGYIDARPQTDSSTKTSCNARPDHTFGSKATLRKVRFWRKANIRSSRDVCGVSEPVFAYTVRAMGPRCDTRLPRFSALSREGQRSGRDIYDLDLGSGLGSLCKRPRIACPRHR